MFSSITTNFPGGVTNARDTQTMGDASVPDPTFAQQYANDFITFAATDLATTLVGTGTTTLSLDTAGGGVLSATTSAASGDSNFYQVPIPAFVLDPARQMFFKAKLKVSEVLNSVLYAGLLSVSATPLTAANSIMLIKSAGVATWFLRISVASAIRDIPLPANLVSVASEYVELGLWYDGQGNLAVFFNPTTGLAKPGPNQARGRVLSIALPTLPTGPLTPSFGVTNGAAAARTLGIDFLVAVAER